MQSSTRQSSGANLNEVNFTGAHFFDTRLREAELKGAILGDIRGSLSQNNWEVQT